jgi:hypothetical protein
VTADPKGDFLSGTSGGVWGKRATSKALAADAYADARTLLSGRPWRLRRAAELMPRLSILALGIERPEEPNLLAAARDELLRSRHDIRFVSSTAGGRGKFENLNLLLAGHTAQDYDWLLLVDDDVALPRHFLDVFVFLIERFGLRLAQPAHRARSHAAWQVTRRRAGSVLRQTAYVEMGPLAALHRETFDVLLPFPDLAAGWGLDAHWAALAAERGWRLGVVDATPIRHRLRRIAAQYDRGEAIAEGHRFLAGKPYIRASEAQQTLVTHRTW